MLKLRAALHVYQSVASVFLIRQHQQSFSCSSVLGLVCHVCCFKMSQIFETCEMSGLHTSQSCKELLLIHLGNFCSLQYIMMDNCYSDVI